jgi:hypothetical protein
MKIYKIVMMSGQEIPLESREALDRFMEAANSGAKLIMTKYGIVNTSSIDSIVPHKELMGEIAEQMKFGHTEEESRGQILGFAPFEEKEIKRLN